MSVNRTGSINFIAPTGAIFPYVATTAPSDWLLCDGTNTHSRSSLAALFNVLMPSKGTFTITIASPGVVTLNGHGLVDGDQVVLATTGALPTGLTADTVNYYVKSPTANTFNLSTSRDSTTGAAGTAINTSGSQSGTHTLYFAPYGKGSSGSTFSVPDLRGRVPVGLDNMGGSDASRLTVANAAGFASGAETHTLTSNELPAHSHGVSDPAHAHYVWTGGAAYSLSARNAGAGNVLGGLTSYSFTGISLQNTGGGGAHNNMQPYVLTNYIIRT